MSSPGTWNRAAPWLAAALAAGAVTLVAALLAELYQLGPLDDAFISLRYAANWAAGRGLCFNPGEKVEGYSNFLLVFLEAVAIRAGVAPLLAMRLIGQAALAGLAALLAAFSFQHVFARRGGLAIIVGSLVALHPMLICWAYSGLEGCLHAMLVLGALTAALSGRAPTCQSGCLGLPRPAPVPVATAATEAAPAGQTGWTILSAVCLVLAAMTRLETVIVFPVILLIVYWQTRSLRVVLLHFAIVAVGFGVYFIPRAVYFGFLFPNTFYAKLDYGSALLAWRGALYVWDFLVGSLPTTLLVLAACGLIRRAPLWVRGCLLLAAVELLGVIYVGGDHFGMFRFLVPVVPLLSLAALYPAGMLLTRATGRSRAQAAAVVVSLAALVGSGLLAGRQPKRDEPRLRSQFAGHLFGCRVAREWELAGRWLGEHTPPDATIGTVAIGAIGFFSERTLVDPHGIVDPTVAHRRQELGHGMSGHEKYDVQRVLSRRPDYILVIHYLTPTPIPLKELAQAAWGDFNQELLRQPELSRLYRPESVRCGLLYLNLLVRRDLPALPAGG